MNKFKKGKSPLTAALSLRPIPSAGTPRNAPFTFK